jgi:hypothetical protein
MIPMDSHDLKRHPLLENQQKTRSKDKADFGSHNSFWG